MKNTSRIIPPRFVSCFAFLLLFSFIFVNADSFQKIGSFYEFNYTFDTSLYNFTVQINQSKSYTLDLGNGFSLEIHSYQHNTNCTNKGNNLSCRASDPSQDDGNKYEIDLIFNETYLLTPVTRINYSFNKYDYIVTGTTYTYPSNYYGWMINNTMINAYTQRSSSGSEPCRLGRSSGSKPGFTTQYIKDTLLSQSCTGLTLNTSGYTDRFRIVMTDGSETHATEWREWDEISIYGLYLDSISSPNELPEFEVNFTPSKPCVNNGSGVINYDVYATDNENDTIYYRFNNLTQEEFTNIEYQTDFSVDMGKIYHLDTTFENEIYPNPSYCDMSFIENDINFSKFFFLNDGTGYELYMSDVCDGLSYFDLFLLPSLQDMHFEFNINELSTEGELFNISFIDTNNNLLSMYLVNISNATHTVISSYNGSKFIPVDSYEISDSQLIYFDLNSSHSSVNSKSGYKLGTSQIRYVRLGIDYGIVQIVSLYYSGNHKDYSWQNDSGGEITITKGYNTFKVDVTDSQHIDIDTYDSYSYTFYADECDNSLFIVNVITGDNGEVTDENGNPVFDPPRIIKSVISKSFKNYLNAWDGTGLSTGVTILYWVFIISFFGLIFLFFVTFGSPSIEGSLFISSICCLAIAFLLEYVQSMFVFGILNALSIAMFIAPAVLNQTSTNFRLPQVKSKSDNNNGRNVR